MGASSVTLANWKPDREAPFIEGVVELLPELCDEDTLVTWTKSWSGQMENGGPKIFLQWIYPKLNACTCGCQSLAYQSFQGTNERSKRVMLPTGELGNRIFTTRGVNVLCKHISASMKISEVAQACQDALLDGLDHWYELKRTA